MIEEQRTGQRQRTLKAGKIMFGGWASIDCVVRNISDSGANLEVESSVGIPDRLELIISKDDLIISKDSVRRSCRVIWRQAQRIGVMFD